MNPAAILRRAAELVESGWCQGSAARDSRGGGVPPGWPTATAWCLTGAIERAYIEAKGIGDKHARLNALPSELGPPLRAAARERGLSAGEGVEWNNDHERTVAEVASLLRRAAEIAEAP